MELAIEKKLADAGYKLFGEREEIIELLLGILKIENIRYLKAIPFLIYTYQPDIPRIYAQTTHKELFNEILVVTGKLFRELGIDRTIPTYAASDARIPSRLPYAEFKEELELQLRNQHRPSLLIDQQKISAERNLQMWLSQLFTKKERAIIKSILEEQPLSKTEYEYYSRKTKKKLNAIANLLDFARTLHEKKLSRETHISAS